MIFLKNTYYENLLIQEIMRGCQSLRYDIDMKKIEELAYQAGYDRKELAVLINKIYE